MPTAATVIQARALGGYRLELAFSDGVRAEVDLARRIVGRGGLFKALEDPAFFQQVRVDPELGTVVWPNEVDICPDLLHQWAMGAPVSNPESEAAAGEVRG